MDDYQFDDQIESEILKDVKSDYESQLMPSANYTGGSLPQKAQINNFALVGTFVVTALIIIAIFAPWYSASLEMSALGERIYINADLSLIGFGASTNFPGMGGGGSWGYYDIPETEEASMVRENVLSIFNTTLYIVIGALITAILALIGVLGIKFHFGNLDKMRRLGTIFSVVTFIIALGACIYFMISLTGRMTDAAGNKIFSFWYSTAVTIFGTDMSMSIGPGYAWYLMIVASVVALISLVFIFKKPSTKPIHKEHVRMKRKKIIAILTVVVIIVVIASVFTFLVLKDEKDESQMDISAFIGKWNVDVDNSSGYHEGFNFTEEIWTFHENKTLKIITAYETGNGSSSGIFNVKDDKLYFAFDAYNYVFSNSNNKLTLTDSDETIILNKV